MENEIVAVIPLLVLVIFAFLLLAIKFAEFIARFNRETKYIIMEINLATDSDEYRYWRRELRCHYLCLIPFVTERNVPKIYNFFFHRPKHDKKENRSDGIFHILAPSLIGICLCAVCLCGESWAWFTARTTAGTTEIQSSSYKLLYQVNEDTDTTELAEAGTDYTLAANVCVIKLKATGTASATGYCSIKIGDETYYTEQIFVNGSAFTFTVNAAAGTQITLTPKWGTYSHDATLHNGDFITATGSQQSNTQPPDNTVTTEPSTEPIAPTAPTTPSITPAESATTAPEPSATAPAATQPEPTDTEPTPAPETATPESTTAAQTEPPTTVESEATE